MTDSERSYATDKDVEQIVGATQRRYQQRLRLRRLLKGMIKREVEKVEDDRAAFIATVYLNG